MYVKIMSVENIPDDDSRKNFRLFENVTEITFERNIIPAAEGTLAGGHRFLLAELIFADGARMSNVICGGNVYVMNANGKTIATHGVAEYVAD